MADNFIHVVLTHLGFGYIRTVAASVGETLNDRVTETCWVVDFLLIPFSSFGAVTSQTGESGFLTHTTEIKF